MEYISGIPETPGDCFLCAYRDRPMDDPSNWVIGRTGDVMILLNRFPYSTGHLLIAPLAHGAGFSATATQTLTNMTRVLRDGVHLLEHALKPDGFNLGMNLGRCAGAGVPDHLHWHIVPRWGGDTNFMPVLADLKVMPEAMQRTYAKLREVAAALNLFRPDA